MKLDRDTVYRELLLEAHAAGVSAVADCTPVPMVVAQRADVLDDSSPVEKSWFVADGLCGFAWVHVPNARQSFCNWLRKNGIGHKSYYGGWDLSPRAVAYAVRRVEETAQSVAKKEAYCRAAAEVLKLNGVDCYTDSRLD
mgnify:CR=1 FL=1